MFLGYRPALNCDLHWIATRTCLGSNSAARVGRRISVLTRGSVGGPALPSTPMVLKVGALRVVSAFVRHRVAVVGTVARRWCGCWDFAGRTGRPVALKTDLAYTKMDQPPRQTNGRTAYQSDSANQVLPSKTHQVDSKRDYGPQVRTNLTLKKILHRVVKLILQGVSGQHTAPMAVVSVAGSDVLLVPRGRGHDMLSAKQLVFAEWTRLTRAVLEPDCSA